MSLINDALKRAKEAQQHAPPSPGPQLRPVEPSQKARRNLGLMLPVAFAAVALCGLFFVWRVSRTNGSSPPPQAAAHPVTSALAEPVRQPAPAPVASAPARPAQVPTPPTALAAGSNTATATTLVAAAAQTEAATNAPAPPRPASLRLQGVVYNPARPSAMINGKSLFVGERIGEFQVRAISQDSATLVGSGQTNVLSLSE